MNCFETLLEKGVHDWKETFERWESEGYCIQDRPYWDKIIEISKFVYVSDFTQDCDPLLMDLHVCGLIPKSHITEEFLDVLRENNISFCFKNFSNGAVFENIPKDYKERSVVFDMLDKWFMKEGEDIPTLAYPESVELLKNTPLQKLAKNVRFQYFEQGKSFIDIYDSIMSDFGSSTIIQSYFETNIDRYILSINPDTEEFFYGPDYEFGIRGAKQQDLGIFGFNVQQNPMGFLYERIIDNIYQGSILEFFVATMYDPTNRELFDLFLKLVKASNNQEINEIIQETKNKKTEPKDDNKELTKLMEDLILERQNLEKEKQRLEKERSELTREKEEENSCKICFSNQIDSVFVPCGHSASCFICSSNLQKCPICRKEFRSITKLYRA